MAILLEMLCQKFIKMLREHALDIRSVITVRYLPWKYLYFKGSKKKENLDISKGDIQPINCVQLFEILKRPLSNRAANKLLL